MKIRLIIAFFFILSVSGTVHGQSADFGMWYGVYGEYSVSKKLDINFNGNLRTFDNAKKTEEVFVEGGLTYKFNKYLSASGSYRFTEQVEKEYGFYIRHKLFASLKGSLRAGDFSFSGRLMFQYQQKTFIENESDEVPDYHGRLKLKSVYKIPAFPLNPYLYYELFSPMFDSSTRFIDKERLSAGVELKITRVQSVECEYIFERDFEPHLSDMNIISINYCLNF